MMLENLHTLDSYLDYEVLRTDSKVHITSGEEACVVVYGVQEDG